MTDANLLGTYLKARRAQVSPEAAGVPLGGLRRVPGLRREEVASLAGLSVDYYARLEQGREQHPSASVLNALARVLHLDPDAQRYLFAIVSSVPKVPVARGGRAVSPNLLELVDEWTDHPTVLLDECHTVVAANHLGRALYGGHPHSDNLARLIFLDDSGRTFFREWPKTASATAAAIRAAATHDPGNAALLALVGELTVRSEEFSTRWAKAEVREKTSGPVLLHHDLVGDLDLHFESMRPNGSPELILKVMRAARGSESADKLAVLGSLTADHGDEVDRQPRSQSSR
ncbi:MAG TPA: helix-turn-helix transcriptional regulator [Pseudonocardia sp.]|nr:helix-turn-helix transcriptional regulator [Pseudonocardia sp.]